MFMMVKRFVVLRVICPSSSNLFNHFLTVCTSMPVCSAKLAIEVARDPLGMRSPMNQPSFQFARMISCTHSATAKGNCAYLQSSSCLAMTMNPLLFSCLIREPHFHTRPV